MIHDACKHTAIEIEPHIPNSERDIIIISSTVGAVILLLVIGIVGVMVCICYYVRKSSNFKKESDV